MDTSELLRALTIWATGQGDLHGAALVGSHANGTAGTDSDVDLVLLTADVQRRLQDTSWAAEIGTVASISVEDWGAVQSVRVTYRSGQEVEFGWADLTWAAEPLDLGTAQVLRNGCRILHDPDGILQAAVNCL